MFDQVSEFQEGRDGVFMMFLIVLSLVACIGAFNFAIVIKMF